MGSTGATNATADAKRAYARLLDVFEDRTESCCLYHADDCRCAGASRDALCRAADVLIEALAELLDGAETAAEERIIEGALARVAGMGKADMT